MFSSSNKKKVHYTASTTGKSSHSHSKGHSHKSSRDSGVGSSSASDRASLGAPNDTPLNSQELRSQRHNPTALAEALDAANDKIRELMENNEQLKHMLKESNKEKRSLREEKNDLIKEVEDLGEELDHEKRAHDKLRREVSGSRTITANSESQRRTTPPSSRRRDDERSQGSGSYHEESSGRRYIVPQPPANNAPNPFIPLSERTSAPSGVSYAAPTTVSYSPVTYAPAPTFSPRPAGSRASYQGSTDGNYHFHPTHRSEIGGEWGRSYPAAAELTHHFRNGTGSLQHLSPPGDLQPQLHNNTLAPRYTMPQFFDSISQNLADWALAQPLFFTGSAPSIGRHINMSPKGLPSSTFTIFSPTSCAYIDATGSGAETISHIYENGRVTIMFCSFGASPRIMRFFCTGRVVEWDMPEFEVLIDKMGKKRVDGARAVVLLTVWKVQTSCGYGVPRIKLGEHDVEKGKEEEAFQDRETLGHWAGNKVEKNEMCDYQLKNNLRSLDGLPGLKTARRDAGERFWIEDVKAKGAKVSGQKEALVAGIFIGILIAVLAGLLQALLV
ncbi:Pyridoxamine 5'-phosphate oxidase family protein ustO [Lachnellula suecica]|uniref:Pyridoxamine 5'-phosphate oxidase family protein ustO n=1 Tax=Lachnellula suecica TaxID=602035 RepID=A0A8T9C6E2_9HELO|nr:Pyridoxamine 5'-phosphate oxidase family protein ustO [Lachnellula suecica]